MNTAEFAVRITGLLADKVLILANQILAGNEVQLHYALSM